MLRTKDILDEKDPRVRAKNTDVTFPLSDEYKKIIPEMLKHLRYSQIEKYSRKKAISELIKSQKINEKISAIEIYMKHLKAE